MTDRRFHRCALAWVLLALGAGTAVVLAHLWLPLVLAAWVTGLLRGPFERVGRGRWRGMAAVGALALLLALLLPVVLAVLALAYQAADFVQGVLALADARRALARLVINRPPGEPLRFGLEGAAELARSYGPGLLRVLRGVAGTTAAGLVGVVLFFSSAYFLLVDGPRMYAWAEARVPLSPPQLRRLVAAFHETGRGLLIGVGLTSLTQGAVATVVYLGLAIPSALLLGLLTVVASLLPVVGTAVVWVPVAAGLAVTGRQGAALLLLGLGTGVIATVDHLVRPLFTRFGRLRLPVLVLFLSMFGGIAAFGASGLLLGPLILRLAGEAVDLWYTPGADA